VPWGVTTIDNEILKITNKFYQMPMCNSHPGMIMILLDQSRAMEGFKATFAARAVNRSIFELTRECYNGDKITNRCFVVVIGYGAKIKPILGGTISKVEEALLGSETIEEDDGAGGVLKMEIPIWVRPEADGGTPMAEAMNQAFPTIEKWSKLCPDSFPPIVINITGGVQDDYIENSDEISAKAVVNISSSKKAFENLLKVSTTDGQLLFVNDYISLSGLESSEIQFSNNRDLISDPRAKVLFDISSVLPATLFESGKRFGLSPRVGARCLVFNSRLETLIKLLPFGS